MAASSVSSYILPYVCPPHTPEAQNCRVSLLLCTLRMDEVLRSSEVFFFFPPPGAPDLNSPRRWLPNLGKATCLPHKRCLLLLHRTDLQRKPSKTSRLLPSASSCLLLHTMLTLTGATPACRGPRMGRCVARPAVAHALGRPLLGGALLHFECVFAIPPWQAFMWPAPPRRHAGVALLTPQLPPTCGEAARTMEGHPSIT